MNRARGFKFVMVGITILNLINIYILFLPIIDYDIYRICADDYIIEKATVVDMQEKAILRGKVSPLIGITETKVAINRDEELNYEKLYTYPDCEISDEIEVAVSGGIVRRCIPYEFMDEDVIDMLGYIIITCVCLVLYAVAIKTEKQGVDLVEDDF